MSVVDINGHAVGEAPDDFERKVGVRYCRRCGRPIVTVDDRRELGGFAKQCKRVEIDLRA